MVTSYLTPALIRGFVPGLTVSCECLVDASGRPAVFWGSGSGGQRRCVGGWLSRGKGSCSRDVWYERIINEKN